MGANKLLPLFGALAICMVLFIGVKSCSRKHESGNPAGFLSEVPKPPAPDADSPADTIRSLTAQVADMKSQTDQLHRENQSLLQQRNEIAAQVSNQVKEDLRREALSERDSAIAQLSNRLDAVAARIGTSTAPPVPTAGSDIPPGLGLDDMAGLDELAWVEPLGPSLMQKAGSSVGALAGKARTAVQDGGSLLHGTGAEGNPILDHVGFGGGQPGQPNTPPPPKPAYTVPRNATLVGSTGMTALLGRVPVKGQVEDPYPFKVIVGSENLAANGLEIPGVDGMIFTGTAIGDWTLSCVRGAIHSVTYVFDDGTIRTLSSDDQSLQQKTQQSAQASGQPATTGNADKPLGWISDRRGIPCVTGQRITNAVGFLGGRILARGIEAAGNAYARSQTTVTTSPFTGGFTSAVTGDPAKFAIGETVSGGADEVARWIAERQAQSFDVVFVDTGAEIAVHVDRELPIDFEPRGRKLSYARTSHETDSDRNGLD
jgi:integrating conjugative element protein (TIGR03752 family)